MIIKEAFHSHPLELVVRLFLDQADVLQDAGDVIHPLCASSCSCQQFADVHQVVRGREHQLQEVAQRLTHGHNFTTTQQKTFTKSLEELNQSIDQLVKGTPLP